eukprot:TRINITY_DN1319_c0_g1_i1.p1 TRINITY_DN1319_c0_g1~~TRINITY_DN1319_c0_g1_i1.p1  ORF type:complete len:314 (-),score=81.15 TRINITY_DN1319_c0_g1_i1:35-976(-)
MMLAQANEKKSQVETKPIVVPDSSDTEPVVVPHSPETIPRPSPAQVFEIIEVPDLAEFEESLKILEESKDYWKWGNTITDAKEKFDHFLDRMINSGSLTKYSDIFYHRINGKLTARGIENDENTNKNTLLALQSLDYSFRRYSSAKQAWAVFDIIFNRQFKNEDIFCGIEEDITSLADIINEIEKIVHLNMSYYRLEEELSELDDHYQLNNSWFLDETLMKDNVTTRVEEAMITAFYQKSEHRSLLALEREIDSLHMIVNLHQQQFFFAEAFRNRSEEKGFSIHVQEKISLMNTEQLSQDVEMVQENANCNIL